MALWVPPPAWSPSPHTAPSMKCPTGLWAPLHPAPIEEGPSRGLGAGRGGSQLFLQRWPTPQGSPVPAGSGKAQSRSAEKPLRRGQGGRRTWPEAHQPEATGQLPPSHLRQQSPQDPLGHPALQEPGFGDKRQKKGCPGGLSAAPTPGPASPPSTGFQAQSSTRRGGGV